MKTKQSILVLVLTFVVAGIIVISCKKDDGPEPELKGKVAFSFENVQKLKSAAPIEDAAAVIVSIEDNLGNLVYDMEEVELYNMNGTFISKPLSLLTGDYSLTSFIVIDDLGNALYASPLEGSAKAYLVDDPLPIEFQITKDVVTKLIPEVLSTEESTPEDFGYSTFSFDVVETFDFLIGVFIYNETSGNFELTTAELTVEGDGTVIYNGEVEAITDMVTVNDGYTEYILTVEKEGYNSYVDTFANAELKLYFSSEDNGPLVVILQADELVMGIPCPGTPTVTDADGNVYPTVLIGDQCWMAANINVGTRIDGIINLTDNGITEKYCYDDLESNCDIYGGIYPWRELMQYSTTEGAQGICPGGWHVPTNAEWKILEGTVDAVYGVGDPEWDKLFAYRGYDAGTQLQPGGVSGLDILMAGDRGPAGNFDGIETEAFLATSTLYNTINSYERRFFPGEARSYNTANGLNDGASVRCLKDE